MWLKHRPTKAAIPIVLSHETRQKTCKLLRTELEHFLEQPRGHDNIGPHANTGNDILTRMELAEQDVAARRMRDILK